MAFYISITRGDVWDTSYEVWGKLNAAPTEYGDGFYIGNYPIQPWETGLAIPWVRPAAGRYGFLIAPVQRRELGPFSQITAQAIA